MIMANITINDLMSKHYKPRWYVGAHGTIHLYAFDPALGNEYEFVEFQGPHNKFANTFGYVNTYVSTYFLQTMIFPDTELAKTMILNFTEKYLYSFDEPATWAMMSQEMNALWESLWISGRVPVTIRMADAALITSIVCNQR